MVVHVERNVFHVLVVGYGFQFIPRAIPCKGGLDLCKDAKPIYGSRFKFIHRDVKQRWCIITRVELELVVSFWRKASTPTNSGRWDI